MSSLPSRLSVPESITLSSLTIAALAILYAILTSRASRQGEPLLASAAFTLIAFSAVYAMIRWLGPTFVAAGLKGKDMSKPIRREIPETMGAVCAVVYLLVIIVFIPFPFYKDIVATTSGGGNRDVVVEEGLLEHIEHGRVMHRFPHSKV